MILRININTYWLVLDEGKSLNKIYLIEIIMTNSTSTGDTDEIKFEESVK